MKRDHLAGLLVLLAIGGVLFWWLSRQVEAPPDGNGGKQDPAVVQLKPAGLKEFVAVDTSRLMALPYPYELERAFPNLSFGRQRPLQILFADEQSDRLFVLCQEGKIHTFENQPDVKEAELFLDLSNKVSRTGNEEGLLGLAFHPKFSETGEFFVCYSAKGPKSVISRLRVLKEKPNQADPDSEEVLLEVPQPHRTQNGGSLEFGPDGMLYIGLGDGGSANDPLQHGQNLETLLGSVLRIDVDRKDEGRNYAIPPDNPFVDRGEKVRGEIWAYGFRNIWRLAFDGKTGALWAGDVGQNRYEEINVIQKGGNYGWSKREGPSPFHEGNMWASLPPLGQYGEESDTFVAPEAHYFHSEGRAVVGGRVYRGSRLPNLKGSYLYADFVTGNIWALHKDEERSNRNTWICDSKLSIAGFGEDQKGELYLCAFDGNIYRLRENEKYLDGGKRRFPYRLSATGLFESTKDLKPVAGVIPYSVNVPLWSDHAAKERFIALPQKAGIEFSEQEIWTFPVGTVVVKNFFMDMTRDDPSTRKRLETRLLVHGPAGWDGYTYIWNDEETDATLTDLAMTVPLEINTPDGPITQNWYFPSRSDCKACHTQVAGYVLSINTRQLNRQHEYAETGSHDQLASWNGIGLFTKPLETTPTESEAYPSWDSDDEPIDQLARAYLDVNCAFCHAPGGPGNSPIDLRYHTPLKQMNMVGLAPRGTTHFGPPASALITPNRPGDSELLRRIDLRGAGQMPILATFIKDDQAISRVGQWIEELSTAEE